MTLTRCALWLRVSTADQTSENQEPELRALAERRGYEVVTTYRLDGESAWSGSAGYRAQLATMVVDAKRGRFEHLLVWSLDRLSREGALATLVLVDSLARVGVNVISVQESWTEAGSPELRELLLAITAWVARMESQRRSERTKAGIERARAEGKRIGRPPGARDGRKRRRSGYFARWAKEREH